MPEFIVYDDTSGEIAFTGSCSDMGAVDKKPGHSIMEGKAEPVLHRVNPATLEIVDKPAYTITVDKMTFTADGVDEATISGIPSGFIVRIRAGGAGHESTVNDGSVEISTPVPGDLTVRLFDGNNVVFEEVFTAVEP